MNNASTVAVWGAMDRPHTVYRYTDQIYKVVQFYDERPLVLSRDPSTFKHTGKKLDASVSRSRRMVLEYALCNHWEWFGTFTLNKSWWDRKDLAGYHKAFMQWLRDYRKKGCDLRYVLVPEVHQDGSWHCHGLFSGITFSDVELFSDMDARGYRSPDGKRLPRRLRNSCYFNWTSYSLKFGYASLGVVKSQVGSAYYISKYITKDISDRVGSFGLHSYWPSRGLQRAEKHAQFVGRDPDLERILVNKYDYCCTGMTSVADGLDFSFCLGYGDFSKLQPLNEPELLPEDERLYYESMDQLEMEWFMRKEF